MGHLMRTFLRVLPTLFIPFLIYALIAFPNGGKTAEVLAQKAFAIPVLTGSWTLTWGGILTLVAICCLFIEVIKSTRTTASAMVENGLSVGLFVLCLILFLIVPGFATTEFFLLTMMCLLDFLAGTVIMTQVAQRSVQVDPNRPY
jgi:hypothetical protein